MNRFFRNRKYVQVFSWNIFFVYSLPFPLIRPSSVMYLEVSNQIRNLDGTYIEWTAFLLLSYQMASTVFKLYILILNLHIQGQDNFLSVLCDSQAPVARSRGMKKSPGPRTRWTWQQCPLMVTQPWIWSDLIRSEVGQHNTTLCHTAT